jgi:hypothetical protein
MEPGGNERDPDIAARAHAPIARGGTNSSKIFNSLGLSTAFKYSEISDEVSSYLAGGNS